MCISERCTDEAWKRVINSGAGGIDKMTIADVEVYGLEKFIHYTYRRF